jgi:hypothetical protein
MHTWARRRSNEGGQPLSSLILLPIGKLSWQECLLMGWPLSCSCPARRKVLRGIEKHKEHVPCHTKRTSGWWFFLTDQASERSLRSVRRDYIDAMAVDAQDDEPDDDTRPPSSRQGALARRRGDRMKRRTFITLIGGAAAWPLAARAQQPGKVYRIGYLGVTSYAEYAREIEALLRGLRRLGYEEGKNIAIVYLFAEGDYDRLPALASELVTLKVDTIVTHSTPGARAAKQATSTIPIVVTAAADLVSSGLVPSIARPAGMRETSRVDQGSRSRGNTARRSRESRQPQRRDGSHGHGACGWLVASGTFAREGNRAG